MLVFETKLEGTNEQYQLLDEAIKTARFVRNACLRYWMDNQNIGRYDLSAYCAVLAANENFPFVAKLNSMARQASAERAWSAIARFLTIASKTKPGRKVIHALKKNRRMGVLSIKLAAGSLVVTVVMSLLATDLKQELSNSGELVTCISTS